MSAELTTALIIVASFLCGSIPFGVIIGWLFGIDPRKVGSGNIGATNVGRALGPLGFTIVFTLDVAKGFLPVFFLGPLMSWGAIDGGMVSLALITVLGNVFSPWMGFRGGKGIATGLGVTLAVAPVAALSALAVFLMVLLISRFVSLGSLSAALALPVAALIHSSIVGWDPASLWVQVYTILIMLVIFITHRSNITKILKGEELRPGSRKEEKAGGAA